MGNPQERSLSWLAAVIECEGSISCQVYTLPDGRVRLTPYVCVVNSDETLLAEVEKIIREIGVTNDRRCKHSTPANKNCWTIRFDGERPVAALLSQLLQYFRSEKKRNAEVLLQYIALRQERRIVRDEKGRVQRAKYRRDEIELIASIRSHKRAKSSETICLAPNVVG